MFGGGLPGLLTGLGAFSFGGFTGSVCRVMGFLLPSGRWCKWGSGLLKSCLCFLTSKKHKQDYKQRGTTTWG